MEISVELTLTPLQDNFEPPIVAYIKALRASGCTIKESPLSTQVYGEFDTVMTLITNTTKKAFEESEHIILNMKIIYLVIKNYYCMTFIRPRRAFA